jgi:hypothetical protein
MICLVCKAIIETPVIVTADGQGLPYCSDECLRDHEKLFEQKLKED